MSSFENTDPDNLSDAQKENLENQAGIEEGSDTTVKETSGGGSRVVRDDGGGGAGGGDDTRPSVPETEAGSRTRGVGFAGELTSERRQNLRQTAREMARSGESVAVAPTDSGQVAIVGEDAGQAARQQTRDVVRERATEQVNRQLDSGEVSPQSIAVTREGDRFTAELDTQVARDIQGYRVQRQIERETGAELPVGSVAVADGEVQLSQQAENAVLSQQTFTPGDRELIAGERRASQRAQQRQFQQRLQDFQAIEQRARANRRRSRRVQREIDGLADEPTVESVTTPIQASQAPDLRGEAVTPPDREGLLEEELQPVICPPGKVERSIGGVAETAAQPVLGPPGAKERILGRGVYEFGDMSADAARGFQSRIVNPASDVAGDAVSQLDILVSRPDLLQDQLAGRDVDARSDAEAARIVDEQGIVNEELREAAMENVQQQTNIGSATEKVTRGVGSLGTGVIRSPETSISVAEAGGSAVQYTAEQLSDEGIEAGTRNVVDASGRVAKTAVTQTAEQC